MTALLAAIVVLAAQPAAPSGPVEDGAGVLTTQDVQRLSALSLDAWNKKHSVQLQYLTVPTLGGDSIEDYANKTFHAWGLGAKGKDNGVLIVVAVVDRKMRIEVGYGLEGAIPDVKASRIVRDVMGPAFKQGRFGDGLLAAGQEIVALANAEAPPPAKAEDLRPIWIFLGVFLILGGGLAVVILILRHRNELEEEEKRRERLRIAERIQARNVKPATPVDMSNLNAVPSGFLMGAAVGLTAEELRRRRDAEDERKEEERRRRRREEDDQRSSSLFSDDSSSLSSSSSSSSDSGGGWSGGGGDSGGGGASGSF